VPSPLPAEVKS